MNEPQRATFIRAYTCDRDCPVIELSVGTDEDDIIAVAHLSPENVEPLIAQLREAAAVGEARRRPPA